MANYLGYEFIDAATVICFDKDGEFNSEKTQHTSLLNTNQFLTTNLLSRLDL